jgi:ureidoacrylate peracid hydrolase
VFVPKGNFSLRICVEEVKSNGGQHLGKTRTNKDRCQKNCPNCGRYEAKTKRVIETNKAVIKASRRKGIKVIYLRMAYRPDLSNAGGTQSPNYYKEAGIVAMRQHAFRNHFLVAGTWDWEIIDDLKPLIGDIVVDKNRYSGFFNTELNSILHTLSIKYLLFVGIATNICVESTLRDAYFYEYFPILVSDGCGNVGPDYTQEATIWNVSTVFGWVTTGAELVQSLL